MMETKYDKGIITLSAKLLQANTCEEFVANTKQVIAKSFNLAREELRKEMEETFSKLFPIEIVGDIYPHLYYSSYFNAEGDEVFSTNISSQDGVIHFSPKRGQGSDVSFRIFPNNGKISVRFDNKLVYEDIAIGVTDMSASNLQNKVMTLFRVKDFFEVVVNNIELLYKKVEDKSRRSRNEKFKELNELEILVDKLNMVMEKSEFEPKTFTITL